MNDNPPIATDLSYDAQEDTQLTIPDSQGVLSGASDPDGNVLGLIQDR